jgi:hypothetical protein
VSPIADNVAITAGSGTSIATDDVGGVHYQKMKLYDATDGASAAIPGDATNGLRVYPRPKASWLQQTSAGLTTATTSYSISDQVGTIFTFTNAAIDSGGTGVILSAVVLDKADVMTDMRLHFWKATVTLASDNAAFTVSDADMQNYLGYVSASAIDVGANRVAVVPNIGLGYSCAATSLFMAVQTMTAHTFYAATTDIWVALHVLLD